jgi:hypothetical protein
MARGEYEEGYNIITVEVAEDRGMAKATELLSKEMRRISKHWKVTLISGPKIDDDPSAGKNTYIGYQAVMLERKS